MLANIVKILSRNPEQSLLDVVAGFWLVTFVLGVLHLPQVI